ncbi:MAG: FtsB family cell division protein [Bacillota bacterium]
MSAPHWRAEQAAMNAPAPVRRLKGNPLRRHWLTGAFVVGLVGVISFTGVHLIRAGDRLEEVRQTRLQVEAELKEVRQKNARLQETLEKVTSDEHMELMAKKMGFTKPNEQVYQTGSPKGN